MQIGMIGLGRMGSNMVRRLVQRGVGAVVYDRDPAAARALELDTETAPLRNPQDHSYHLDVGEVAELWRRGSVAGSWLLDLTAEALLDGADLGAYDGHVSDSGEGRWTIQAAVDEAVPAPVLTAALYGRFASRGEATYANKLLSAMRSGFGGHRERS